MILDGTDNFPTRYLVNDACVLSGKPNAYGSIFRFEGQASVFATKEGPCYRCLYPEPPPPGLVPSCAEGGVLGVLPGIIGVIQATESDQADPRHRRAAHRPLPDLRRAEDAVPRAEAAEGSGVPGVRHESHRHQADRLRAVLRHPAGAAAGAEHGAAVNDWEITPVELKTKLDAGETPFILDVREPNEYQINRIAGSTLIPLGELPRRYQELPRDREIIAQCKMGGRSAKAHGLPEVGGLHQRQEPARRHPGVDRQGRPEPAEVLTPGGRLWLTGNPLQGVNYDFKGRI